MIGKMEVVIGSAKTNTGSIEEYLKFKAKYKLPTTIYKLIMEVHAHTHTSRKKWTHYFWEFLMLFLAVFCGFLAEYQLEHKIEKERERQFMASMIEDLKSDKFLLYENINLR